MTLRGLVESRRKARHAGNASDERRVRLALLDVAARHRLSLLDDAGREAESSPAHGHEDLLKLVSDGATRLQDRTRERGFAHREPRPHGVEELAAKDYAIAGAHEREQELEDLRLDRHLHAGAP